MKSSRLYLRSVWVVLASMQYLGQSACAQNTSLLGKIQAVGHQGITVVPNENDNDTQPVFVAAARLTQVRMNVLASPDKILPGAYVEMRVLWDGQSALRATSIKFPEGIPKKIGLFKG